MRALLTVAFVLSGAAGLMYESIWSRYLGLFVGHGAYAQVLVLVIFLGGMSLGAWLAGERSSRLARPLVGYAVVEILAGLGGFLFHPVFDATTRAAYDTLFPAIAPAGDTAVTIATWTIAGLLILPQSVLLGTTFPLMSAGVLRREPDRPGHILGLLYFANSLGAAAGVLVAGFWLVSRFGLPGTLRAAAVINLAVGVVVLLAARHRTGVGATVEAGLHPAPTPPAPEATTPHARPPTPHALLLGVAFGTAVASFVYEIAWIRMLALVLGSATHSFELMLSAFILGLALGAWWIRRRADRLHDPLAALGVAQWAMGVLAIATLPLYVASFGWMATLSDVFRPSAEGYAAYGIARYLICLLVMLPATFCAGMTLPLITRLLLGAGAGERAIGIVYSVNTLGSILGVALAALVLLPVLGLQLLLVVGALVDIALGIVLLAGPHGSARSTRSRNLVRTAAAATVVFVLSNLAYVRLDLALLSSGVFRYGELPPANRVRVRFYRDGRTATVTVKDHGPGTLLTLATNGKPDASMDPAWASGDRTATALTLSSDMATQLLLPLVTLAHAPGARTAAVIGHGSGMTSHVLLASRRLESLETIEIEPQMIEASRAFLPANRRVFEDPRATFVVDDAKAHFAAGRRTYDLILSEPSNPWVSGVSGLFTREFYQRVRRHLTPDGVFGQWLHLYEIDDELVLGVLAALDESFPSYDVYFVGSGDVLIVASAQRRLPAPDWSVVELPAIREDLRGAVPLVPEALDRMRFASAATLRPLLATVPRPNSDYDPVLDMGAERARFLRTGAEGIRSLGNERLDVTAALEGRRVDFGSVGTAATPEIARVVGLARGARLRAARDGRRIPTPFAVADAKFDSASYRLQRVRALARGDERPESWRMWLSDVLAVESVLHMGTAGVADARFYDEARDYARRAGAPPGVHDALAFRHGLAAWDWREALEAAERLVLARRAGSLWLPIEDLHDGGVVAAIRLGERARALALIAELSPLVDRDDRAFHLRTRLLQSHVTGLGARDAP